MNRNDLWLARAVGTVVLCLAASCGWAAESFDLKWGKQVADPAREGNVGSSLHLAPGGTLSSLSMTFGSSTSTVTTWRNLSTNGDLLGATSETRTWMEHPTQTLLDGVGNKYVLGYADGPSGGTHYGWRDGFVRKYSSSGSLLWQKQYGGSGYDSFLGGYLNANGDLFCAGSNALAQSIVAKYDRDGNEQWVRGYDLHPYNEQAGKVIQDPSGCLYMMASGGLSDSDWGTSVSKLSVDGTRLWTKQIGASWSQIGGFHFVGHDSQGRLIVMAETKTSLGGLSQGGCDVSLGWMNGDGNFTWLGQYGTAGDDAVYSAVIDTDDRLTMVGHTNGSWFASNQGQNDAYIAQVDLHTGDLLRGAQVGTAGGETFSSITTDGVSFFVSGSTNGSLWSTNGGDYDTIVGSFAVPEPATLSLLVLGGLAAMRKRRA